MQAMICLSSLRHRVVAALAVFAALGAFASPAVAADLDAPDGILLGARNVLVGEALYNVSFQDGSCNSLFDGCTNFTFTTELAARVASMALLDQVFLDAPGRLFDTQPLATRGCPGPPSSSLLFCAVITPWSPTGSDGLVLTYVAVNYELEDLDTHGPLLEAPDNDFSSVSQAAYAVWSPVPEPSAYALAGAGLVVLFAFGRRRQPKAVGQQPA